MSHCPEENRLCTRGGSATVRERASTLSVSNVESIRHVGARSLTNLVSARNIPKVSHWSRKWDSLVGHFIVVFNVFNPACPTVPPYMVNRPLCPIRPCFVPCPTVPEKNEVIRARHSALRVPHSALEKSGGEPAFPTAFGRVLSPAFRRPTDGARRIRPLTQGGTYTNYAFRIPLSVACQRSSVDGTTV
jgi:hypothetical protein